MRKILILFFSIFLFPVFAEMVNDFTNMCGVSGYHYIYAIPKSFTCLQGEFLPANAIECVSCPNGYECNGGLYYFSSTIAQGLIKNENDPYIYSGINNTCATNTGHIINGIYLPHVHTCSPGYYLPANIDSCTICPLNHYCDGGIFTFNETTNQGITACPSDHPFAPVGMWQSSQCGRKLHLGDDILYMHQQQANPTVHQLHISYNNVTYSANAVLRDMTPGADFPKVSAGATKGLHIKIHETINGIEGDYEYLICDDSVCPNQ